MTDEEKLLETCMHEAAHFAFAVWARCPLFEISIGQNNFGSFVSDGYVAHDVPEGTSVLTVAVISAAGAAMDAFRAKLSHDQIFEQSEGDRTNFAEWLRTILPDTTDEEALLTYMQGLKAAGANLEEPSKEAEIVCLGRAIFNRCVDGRVVIQSHELQALFDECRSA